MSADALRAIRDPALPGLAMLLDASAFTDALRALVPHADLLGARGFYVRYKPGARCLAAYRVASRDGDVLVHGIAHGTDAPEKLAKRSAQRAIPGALGVGRLVREDLALAIEVFPNDARLRVLPRLASAEFRNHLMTRMDVLGPESAVVGILPLAYKPERRFVARVDLDDGSHALLKLHTPERFQAVHTKPVFTSRNALRVARAFRASRNHGALAYEWIEGRPLAALAPDAGHTLACAGEALAELHAQKPAQRERRLGPEALASAALVAVLVPKLGGTVRALADRIAGRLASPTAQVRALHGDFHAAQILAGGDTVGLIDLDNTCAGDPAQDLAVFVAHAELEAARSRRDPDVVATALATLLTGYERVAAPPDPRSLALHTAAALVSIAPQPFRCFDPAWPERIEALLERARAWLDRAGPASAAGPATAARGTSAPALDAALPFLAAALDRRRMAIRLARVLDEPGLQLRDARLVRHKPGRRALVEYDLTAGDGSRRSVLGKLRARGLDRPALRVQDALYRTAFGDDALDGISVPRPLGAIPKLFLWLQRKVPGTPVTGRLGQAGDAALCQRAATALHKLHATTVPTSRHHGVDDEVELLCGRLLPQLVRTHPEFGSRCARLAAACRRLGATIPDPPRCGIHRDFHPDQVLVYGSRLWLVDFDLYCQGHPALDAGNFLAHLTELALRRLGDPAALASCERAFEERFLALSGEELQPALHGYTVLSLARHVYLSTRYEDRQATTASLLELCEQRLDLGPPATPALPARAAR